MWFSWYLMSHRGISFVIHCYSIQDDSKIGIQGKFASLQVDRGVPCNLSKGVIRDFFALLDTHFSHIHMSIFSLQRLQVDHAILDIGIKLPWELHCWIPGEISHWVEYSLASFSTLVLKVTFEHGVIWHMGPTSHGLWQLHWHGISVHINHLGHVYTSSIHVDTYLALILIYLHYVLLTP